jgi:Carboxypeptidase regulatory-like domain
MTQRTPTSDVESSTAAPAIPFGMCCPRAARVWIFLAVFGFWAGATAVHASAVITFTNFPPAVSNTYNGIITLEINGLTNGVTNVVVQKFLDANTNGVIDAGDLLVQQFQLAVGQAPVFTNGNTLVTATNFMPGDVSPATNQIITPLNFQNGDFMQNLVGQYLYKISSPSGQFAPVTNLFIVTNAFPSSLVTGAVENASSFTNIPNAIVLLFSAQNGGGQAQAGAVANNAGYYSIAAPPGTYYLAAAKSNFVINLGAQPEFSLFANSTNPEPIGLTSATTNITGRAVVNAVTNSIGVPGLLGLAESTNDYLSLYFTDTNGNFVAPVTSNAWTAPIDASAAAFAGYLTIVTNALLVVSNAAVHLTNALPQATAIFYGTVTNVSGTAMSGIFLYAVDSEDRQSWCLTDSHGNYVLDAVGGTNQWQLAISAASLTNNYVFSPGYVSTNINAGQAIQENFTLASAPYTITGSVKDYNGNPIAGVEVFATATNINGLAFQAFDATTDNNGDYTLYVSPGTWTVGVSQSSLMSLGYDNFPANQTVTISDAGATGVNFSIEVCGEIEITTTNLPNAFVGSSYNATLSALSCQPVTNWFLADGVTLTSLYDQTNITYPAGTPIYSSTNLVGYLFTTFLYGLLKQSDGQLSPVISNCTASYYTGGGSDYYFYNISAPVIVSSPLASNTVVLISSPQGIGELWTATATVPSDGYYQTTLTRPGTDEFYSGKKPATYFLAQSGTFMTGTSGTTDTVAVLAGVFNSLNSGDSQNLASTIPYTGADGATVWLQTGTNNWGEYFISAHGPQGGSLPPGLTLSTNGTITGTPTSAGTNGIFNFAVAAEDTSSNVAIQPLSITVSPLTTLSSQGLMQSSNTFQMQINGVLTGYNYTVQMSTNLASTNWTDIFTTNAPGTNALIIPDANATNQERFYRIQVAP